MNIWLVILIGLIGGVAVGLQTPLAGAITGRLGSTAGSFVIHLSGLIFSGLFLIVRGGEKVKDWVTLPWYMLCVGFFGLALFLTINVTFPRLGSTMMVVLIIVGQLMVGVLIDHFGLLGVTVRPFDLSRAAGILVLVAGAYLISK